MHENFILHVFYYHSYCYHDKIQFHWRLYQGYHSQTGCNILFYDPLKLALFSALVQIKARKDHNWLMVSSRRIILISISVITVNPQLFKMKNIYLKNM